jgi:hypothetical protein
MALLKKLFASGTNELVKNVGTIIDNVHTSEEEKTKLKIELENTIKEYESKLDVEISKRWEADMKSDNWLAKSIRPLSLAFLLLVLTVFTLIDFGFADLDIKDSWVDLWQLLSITAFGAYFGSRGLEKIKK